MTPWSRTQRTSSSSTRLRPWTTRRTMTMTRMTSFATTMTSRGTMTTCRPSWWRRRRIRRRMVVLAYVRPLETQGMEGQPTTRIPVPSVWVRILFYSIFNPIFAWREMFTSLSWFVLSKPFNGLISLLSMVRGLWKVKFHETNHLNSILKWIVKKHLFLS